MMVRQINARRILNKFRKDKKGATAVELALVLPVLLTTIFGIIELSMGMYINTVVEGSLRDAARLGLTGQIQEGVSNSQALVDIINDASGGIVNLSTSDVTTLVYDSFADVGQGEDYTDLDGNGNWTAGPYTDSDGTVYPEGEPWVDQNGNAVWDEDLGEAGLGSNGSIVLYTVTYDWNFLSGQVIPILNGTIPMTATIVVQNEPYTASSSS